MKQKLYFFTNAFPYGIGEDWKMNELNILSKHFHQIEVIPYQYDGNVSPRKIDPENIVVSKPLFEDNSIVVSWSAMLQILFSRYFLYFFREFWKKKVYTNKSTLKIFFSDAVKTIRLAGHPQVAKVMKEQNANSVFYFFWGKGSCLLVPLMKKKIKGKVVVRFHGFDLYEYRNNDYIPFRTQLLKSIDKALVISNNGAQYLGSKYPSVQEKLMLNRLGTLQKGMSVQSTDGVLRIFSCSALIPLKRVTLLAEALKLLTIKVNWTHIGDGPELDKLKAIIQTLPANINVRLTGWVSPEKVAGYYAGQPCDLFINVSETEGIPVSIMEAFSAAIPALATNVGGVSEIVTDQNGRLLDPNPDAYKLAYEIARFQMITNEKKQEMRNQAYNTFRNYFDADNNAQALASICVS